MRAHAVDFLCAVFLLCCSALGYGQNYQAAIGDLNGDGKPDIVVANPSLNNVGVFLNAGSGALGPGTFLAVSGRPDSISLADLNSDGHLDILLVVVGSGTSQLQVMLGDGHGGFAAPVAAPTGSVAPITNTIVADFNGDGLPDVAFGIIAESLQIAVIFGDGHSGFSAPRLIAAGNDTTGAVELLLLDVNKDGKPDLIVNTSRVSAGIHESFLLINDGKANFSVSQLSTSPPNNDIAGFVTAIGDFNGDGNPDLLFATGGADIIMFGDGQGGTLSVSPSRLLLGIPVPQGFAAADVDGNQTIDVVSSSVSSYFPGNGHGGFGDPISLSLPQGSTLIAVADFNGDGKPDFVLQSGTNVSVMLNSLTAPATFSASTQIQLLPSVATTSVGLPVTLAASVFSYGGVPTGTVTFFDGAQSLGSAPVDIYGIAAVTTTFSSAGLHNNLAASFAGTLDASTNTIFGNSNTQASPSSISVNTSQPTASTPTVALSALPNPARVRNSVTLTANVTSSSGTPTGNVVVRSDGDVLALFPVGQTASVIFPTVGLHSLQATYGGDATFPQATSPTMVEDVRVSVPGDFAVNASPQSATIKAGQTATFTITINPINGMASAVTFGCSGLPAASSCTFSPASLTPNGSPVSTTLTINTTAPSSATVPVARLHPGTFAWSVAIVLGLLVAGNFQTTRKAKSRWRALAGMAVVLCIVSCGGGDSTVPQPNGGTPPGAASITVTATSGVSHTAALSVTVTP